MADTIAIFGQQTSWTSTGTGDTLTCQDIPNNRHGVQIDADGITLEDATVTVHASAGATHVVDVPTGAGEVAVVGEGFRMTKIVISGVSAGTYPVRFSQ